MKKFFITAIMTLTAVSMMAADVKLPAPETTKGLPAMQAFAERKSTRQFSDKQLSQQDLSNLLWATMGVNREDGKLTAPTCQNKQEIRLFMVDKDAAYEYMPAEHSLRHLADGDFRALVAGRQEFAKTAPISLIIVADMEKFGKTDPRSMTMAAIDAGIVTENACVAAAALGLATVPRASMETAELAKSLGLTDKQILLMNLPVGYFAE